MAYGGFVLASGMETTKMAGLLRSLGALGKGAVGVAVLSGLMLGKGDGVSISYKQKIDMGTRSHTVASSLPAAWRPPMWPASFAASQPLVKVPSALRSVEGMMSEICDV